MNLHLGGMDGMDGMDGMERKGNGGMVAGKILLADAVAASVGDDN